MQLETKLSWWSVFARTSWPPEEEGAGAAEEAAAGAAEAGRRLRRLLRPLHRLQRRGRWQQ